MALLVPIFMSQLQPQVTSKTVALVPDEHFSREGIIQTPLLRGSPHLPSGLARAGGLRTRRRAGDLSFGAESF